MIIKLFKGGERQVNIFEQRVSYNVEQFLDLLDTIRSFPRCIISK